MLTPAVLKSYIPLLAFGEERLRALLEHCQLWRVRAGQVLMEPGRANTQACFLLSGTISCRSTAERYDPTFCRAIPFRQAPQETLVAETDCSLFCVDREILDRLLCWSESARYLEDVICSLRQYDAEQEWMLMLLRSNLFYKVSPLNLQKVFVHLSPKKVRKGEVIIRQGDLGDCCYVLREGNARVTRRLTGRNEDTHLADVGPGRCFGEDALIHETVRNASITMLTDGLLMKMDKRDFVQLLKEPPVNSVSSRDLDLLLRSGATLLDVRTPEEFYYQHLEGAISFPLASLHFLARELDSYRHYIVYCDSGRRSRVAASLLAEQGFRVEALHGGLNLLPPTQQPTSPAL